MSDQACPLPNEPSAGEREAMRKMLAARRIAVVGATEEPEKAGHYVPAYLAAHEYEIVPVNPKYEQVLGRKCYKSLHELPSAPDVVLVFRRAEACPAVVGEAIGAAAKGVWLQAGIHSEEARQLAEGAGIGFVQDRCMMVEHRRRH